MHSFPDLITILGGPTVVAKAAGVPAGVARQWKARGSIPPAYWPSIIDLAKERDVSGVTVESLGALAISADQRRAPPKAAQQDAA